MAKHEDEEAPSFDVAAAKRDFVALAELFLADTRVSAGKLFASDGLKVDGKSFAVIVNGDLVVKLPRARVDELVESGVATRFDPGHGRQMREWASFSEHRDSWARLAREALAYVTATDRPPDAIATDPPPEG